MASYAPSRAHAAQPLVWESVDGQLRVNGRRFHLKGTNVRVCVCVVNVFWPEVAYDSVCARLCACNGRGMWPCSELEWSYL